MRQPARRVPPFALLAATLPARTAAAAPSAAPHRCGERRPCTGMRSCEEAMYHVRVCGLTRLDGDRDGVPCERLCDRGTRRRRGLPRRRRSATGPAFPDKDPPA